MNKTTVGERHLPLSLEPRSYQNHRRSQSEFLFLNHRSRCIATLPVENYLGSIIVIKPPMRYFTLFVLFFSVFASCSKQPEPLPPDTDPPVDTLPGTEIPDDTSVIKDGTVYVVTFDRMNIDVGYLYAIDARTGKKKWHFTAPKRMVSTPVYHDGIVYVADVIGTLYAVDTLTHAARWTLQVRTAPIQSPPAIADGIIYIVDMEEWLYAVDLSTHSLKWQKFIGDNSDLPVATSAPTVVDGTLYIGSEDQYLYALDALTGAEKWKYFDTHALGAQIASSPAVANGTVYFGDNNNHAIALDALTGAERWVFKTDGMVISGPTIANDIVYVSSEWHSLYALHANTGEKIWSYYAVYGFDASPVISGNRVYIGEDDAPQGPSRFFAFDAATGDIEWTFVAGHGFESPVVFGNGIIASTYDRVFGLDKRDGKAAWTYLLTGSDNELIGSPLVVDASGMPHYPTISGQVQ